MGGTAKYLLIEERLGKPLDETLRYYFGLGVPASAIARLLAHETRVEVTGQTIRMWSRDLDGRDSAA